MFASARSSLGGCLSLLFTSSLLVNLTGPAWCQTDRLDDRGGVVRATAAPPVIFPGGVRLFPVRDGVGVGPLVTGAEIYAGPGANPAMAKLGNDLPAAFPLSSFLCAGDRLSRATGEIFRYNDFTVDKTWPNETVLQGEVTGTVLVRGFLFLIGIGQAKSEVLVEVLDITDPANILVVNCKTLSHHELLSALRTSVDVGLNVEGGASYLGGGLGVGTGSSIDLQLNKVRDTVDFGMDVSLRRGHTYRLIIKIKSEALLTAAGGVLEQVPGKAAAIFYDPGLVPFNAMVPNLLDKQVEKLLLVDDTLRVSLNPDLPDIRMGLLSPPPNVPALTPDNAQLFNDLWPIHFVIKRQGNRIRDILNNKFGLNILDPVPANPTLPTPTDLAFRYFAFNNKNLGEEQVNTPGVTVTRLMLSLEQDQVELAERQRIEDSVEQGRLNLDHIFPEHLGGKLEKVFVLVKERIDQAVFAGVPFHEVEEAQVLFIRAGQARDFGFFRLANRLLVHAYNELTEDEDDDDHEGDDHDGDDGDDDHDGF